MRPRGNSNTRVYFQLGHCCVTRALTTQTFSEAYTDMPHLTTSYHSPREKGFPIGLLNPLPFQVAHASGGFYSHLTAQHWRSSRTGPFPPLSLVHQPAFNVVSFTVSTKDLTQAASWKKWCPYCHNRCCRKGSDTICSQVPG